MKDLELICQRCDRDYPVWSAQNEIWNDVIRQGSVGGIEDFSFLCPTCFVVRAAMLGINPVWNLVPNHADYGEILEKIMLRRKDLPYEEI